MVAVNVAYMTCRAGTHRTVDLEQRGTSWCCTSCGEEVYVEGSDATFYIAVNGEIRVTMNRPMAVTPSRQDQIMLSRDPS